MQGERIPLLKSGGKRPITRLDTRPWSKWDARSGQVAFLDLRDEGFFDQKVALRLSNTVYHADPPQKERPRKRVLPPPTTNQAAEVIGNWNSSWFGGTQMGINPGNQTSLERCQLGGLLFVATA